MLLKIVSSKAFRLSWWSILLLTVLYHIGLDLPSPIDTFAKMAAGFVGILLNPFVFIPVFCAAWYYGLRYFAAHTGWTHLAEDYAFDQSQSEMNVSLKAVSGTIRGFNFARIYRIGASEAGLVIAATIPFRPGHPPLLIPWSNIEVIPNAQQKGSNLLSRLVRRDTVSIGILSHPEVDLQVYSDDFGKTTAVAYSK